MQLLLLSLNRENLLPTEYSENWVDATGAVIQFNSKPETVAIHFSF
jgi:hypothetical protein